LNIEIHSFLHSALGHALMRGALGSISTCLLLILTKRLHGCITFDSTEGLQKFHIAPTPRIGGVAILAGFLITWPLVPAQPGYLLGYMLLAGTPAFFFGLAEDLTMRVGIRMRLLATMASGVLACHLTGTSIDRVDMWGMDTLLAFPPISIAFTAFAVGGVANSINIIDGFNGLASGTIMLCLAAIGAIAFQVGDMALLQLCLIIIAVTAGFWVVNFPFGKIFLGDGGAYLLGFLLGWAAVLLPARNPQVSPWASLLACGYPILETVFSIWRKSRRDGYSPGQPDRVHLHMLMYSRIAKRYSQELTPSLRNALTSPFVWSYAIVPPLFAVTWPQSTVRLLLGLAASILLYIAIYLRLTRFRWFKVGAPFLHSSGIASAVTPSEARVLRRRVKIT
jgi:UDP-N-acetylmuramyl pentapeptide phosphotransferase/UDP-N-acetylglucosamine-1-phosphate transferase